MEKHLHIITHDVPFGGRADVFSSVVFKVKALKEAGIKVHMHCFENKSVKETSIGEYCHEIYFYQRKRLVSRKDFLLPYTLATRSSDELMERLKGDDYPILFEGLQSVYPLLQKGLLKKRKTLVRLQRVESRYFKDLANIRHWGLKKIAFALESFLFSRVEKKIFSLSPVSVSTESIFRFYQKQDPKRSIHLIPEFTGIPASYFQEGKGGFCLYHGDLSNRENEYAAQWLLEHVFNKIEIPFVIAGYGPSNSLEKAAHLRLHTCLVANPGEKEILDLIKKAQICLLPSFISSDNKSPVLKSLALGKHVLTNAKGIADKEMESVCAVARTPDNFIASIEKLFSEEFDRKTFEKREAYLNRIYRDPQSTADLIKLLY